MGGFLRHARITNMTSERALFFAFFLCDGRQLKWVNQKSTISYTQCKCLLANHWRRQNSSKNENFGGMGGNGGMAPPEAGWASNEGKPKN